MKSGKIYIGPVEVAGYYYNLSRGLTEIGFDVDFATFGTHHFGYGQQNKLPRLLIWRQWLYGCRGQLKYPWLVRQMAGVSGRILLLIWTMAAIVRYDVFIFGFGASLLPGNWDLPLLRLLRKTVISNMGHGSEARPPYIDGSYQSKDGAQQPTSDTLYRSSYRVFRKVQKVQKWSTITIGAPFNLSHFSSVPFINLFALGLPFVGDKESCNDSVPPEKSKFEECSKTVRILHSPSHPAVKGSARIGRAIEFLKSKGHQIEFIQLCGKPHSEVIAEIKQCDFVVDQAYSDTPMAGFALEAAWYGKPAVVGGYCLDQMRPFVAEGMWPPSKICHPDQIESAIEDLIVNRQNRLHLGAEAMKFARQVWSAREVAKRFRKIIDGDIPNDWWVEPKQVSYLLGVGQLIEQTKNNTRELIDKFGIKALQLGNRPDLELEFKRLIESE